MRKRCGSGAEAVRKWCGTVRNGAEAVQLVKLPGRNIARRDNYPEGRIAGEVAVFDSQDPVVHDRSAALCK